MQIEKENAPMFYNIYKRRYEILCYIKDVQKEGMVEENIIQETVREGLHYSIIIGINTEYYTARKPMLHNFPAVKRTSI